jgi:hypothetical protein
MAVSIPIISEFNGRGIRKAMAEFKQLETVGQKTGFALKKAGGIAALGFAAVLGTGIAVGNMLLGWARNAEEARRVQAKLNSVLDQMGVGEAAQRVSAYAEQLEKTFGIDADVIKRTQTKLATFSKLTKTVGKTGGAFDRATKAALDLAAAGFGEAEMNAVQLGKALQDPIKGISALARAGVSFTEDEKKKIRALVESNRLLEAQDVILQAIEGQVGGTAEANVSSFDKINLAVERVKDQVGNALLPVIERMVPYLEKFADMAEAVGEAFGKYGIAGAWEELKRQFAQAGFEQSPVGQFFRDMYNLVRTVYNALVDLWNISMTISGAKMLSNISGAFGGPELPRFSKMPEFGGFFNVNMPSSAGQFRMRESGTIPQSVIINVNGGDPAATVDALRRYSRQNGGISGVRLS